MLSIRVGECTDLKQSAYRSCPSLINRLNKTPVQLGLKIIVVFPGLLECSLKIFRRGLKVNAQSSACKSIHCLSPYPGYSLKSLKNGVTKGVGGHRQDHLYKKGLEMWKKLKIKTRTYSVTLKKYYTLTCVVVNFQLIQANLIKDFEFENASKSKNFEF